MPAININPIGSPSTIPHGSDHRRVMMISNARRIRNHLERARDFLAWSVRRRQRRCLHRRCRHQKQVKVSQSLVIGSGDPDA